MQPADLKYTKDHEWIRDEGGVFTVGITAHAAEQLGDVTYVELPAVGKRLAQGDAAAAVESVKAAGDVYAPIGGRVAAVNEELEANPERVNQEPYGEGWFFKLDEAEASQLATLMDATAYAAYVQGLES